MTCECGLGSHADLAPLYQYLCTELGWPLDSARLTAMQEVNAGKVAELELKRKDAEENLGETEVRDAMLAKAEFLGSVCDREAAGKAYDEVEKKTASGGNRVDLLLSQIRCACVGGREVGRGDAGGEGGGCEE